MSEAVTAEGSQSQAIQPRERRLAGFWHRFKRNRLAVFGLVIVALMLLTAVFAPLIAPKDPQAQDYALTLQPPGVGGLMGTDSLGSDVFSRVVFGARISLYSSLISVGIALLIGVPVGLTSGYFRGIWDEWIVMRIVDSLQAFPFLILALVIAAILGGGLGYAMIAIGIGFVPAFVRITRAQVLTVRSLDYVDAARAIGTGHMGIMLRHVLPNSLPPLLVPTTPPVGYAILAAAPPPPPAPRRPPPRAWASGLSRASRAGARCSSRPSHTSRPRGGWRSSRAWRSSSPSSASTSSATASARPSTPEPTTRERDRPLTRIVATFSIAAFDPETDSLGVAVQSKFLAVGSVVPWARAGVGALATQALANFNYGPRGLDLMSKGHTAEQTVGAPTSSDAGGDARGRKG